MSKIVQEITSTGLHLPKSLIERWGWHEGTKVFIENRGHSIFISLQELTAVDIANQACNYLLEHVGDAVAVKTPYWLNDHWVVPVILSFQKKDLGELTFSRSGELIIEKSDTPATLLERANEN
ncbi:AbrB/MazE/SpoVT family DNA-binding domain-containing protein [candidate division KSB1 bacterium]|nr:AbrB/MazE/SpoVT family DNA-binding domain-containing protein [candidate division KSB1 bacterium]